MTSSATKLATWVRGNVPQQSGALTQLKLQKLLFYSYSAALAFGVEHLVGDVPFEAWRHGPVCPEVFQEYRHHGAHPLPQVDAREEYPAAAAAPMIDALSIYSWLDAWQLREQSHLEKPWQDAAARGGRAVLDREELRKHFVSKFRDRVYVPEYLGRSWNFAIDGIPDARFASLHELADTIRQRLG